MTQQREEKKIKKIKENSRQGWGKCTREKGMRSRRKANEFYSAWCVWMDRQIGDLYFRKGLSLTFIKLSAILNGFVFCFFFLNIFIEIIIWEVPTRDICIESISPFFLNVYFFHFSWPVHVVWRSNGPIFASIICSSSLPVPPFFFLFENQWNEEGKPFKQQF